MTINIDLEVLIKEDLTPDDYVFLWGLYHNYNLNDVEFYPNHIPLEEKGFIKLGEDWMLRTRGKLLFEPQGLDAKFIEFFSSYPFRAGQRVLRDKNCDTKQALLCKRKYEIILKKHPNIHSKVMEGLHNYVKSTENRFLCGVEVFLNQEMWNKYVGDIKEKDNSELGTTESI